MKTENRSPAEAGHRGIETASQRQDAPNRPENQDCRLSGQPVDLRDVRFTRAVEAVHRLGPRVLAEMLAELGAQRLIRTEIEELVSRYSRIDPKILAAAGGWGWPR